MVGSVVLCLAAYTTLGDLWTTLAFFALLTVMSAFLSAYYAALRIER